MEEDKTIYELLDVEPIKKESLVPAVVVEDTAEQDSYEADFEEARRNLLYLIDTAKTALEDVHVIAKEKEGAKEYDSLNGLLRTVGDASGNLLKLHMERKKFKERIKKKEEMKNGIAVNNAVFVGSSSDFRKLRNPDD